MNNPADTSTRGQMPSLRKRPVQSRSRALVDAVEQACLQILDEAGEAALTVARISELSGVAVGSIYQYFPSKDAIVALLYERALAHKIVLPMATGGSIAHMLAVDYALKPVLSALKAQELLHGIFAEDSQIAYAEGSAQAQLVPVLEQRLHEALETLYGAMARRPKPLDPNLLNERLLSARWSI